MTELPHEYERGWQRYGFDNQEFAERAIHGSSTPISMKIAFHRGRWKPQISFATIAPDTPGEAIGMHVHRDVPTGTDLEEWYIVVDGEGEMTFSNGDCVAIGPGDLVATYPGTGHSFRAKSGPARIIVITPQMFLSPNPIDDYPEEFTPRIKALQIDDAKSVVKAMCTVCGAEWNRPNGTTNADALPAWAREHACHGV